MSQPFAIYTKVPESGTSVGNTATSHLQASVNIYTHTHKKTFLYLNFEFLTHIKMPLHCNTPHKEAGKRKMALTI